MEVERGQSAVVDATLIAPILVLILLMGAYIYSTNTNVFMLEKNENNYAQDTMYSLLKATIQKVEYRDAEGNLIVLEDKSVEQLISEDLYLRATHGADISTVRSGIESKINDILHGMTIPYYKYSLHAQYNGVSFVIGQGTLPVNRMSYTTYIDMPQNNGRAIVTLYVWRVR